MDIKKSEFTISAATVSQCPKDTKPEFAFIGRSNVGKSSLINMLCNTGQNSAHQSLHHQQRLVSGRPSGLRFRKAFEDGAEEARPDDYIVHSAAPTTGEHLRAHRHPPRPDEDRHRLHQLARRELGALLHHLHKGRQARTCTCQAERSEVDELA